MIGITERLRAALARWGEPPPEVLRQLAEQAGTHELRRHQHVMRPGDRNDRLYWVERGLWRVYYTRADGREFARAFVAENMYFVALDAFLRREPVRFSVQALEASQAISLPYALFHQACQDDIATARMWQRYMEQHFTRHYRREEALLLQTPEQRYAGFLDEYPQLASRVPLHHIASFLGMTNVSLSRIRRRREARSGSGNSAAR